MLKFVLPGSGVPYLMKDCRLPLKGGEITNGTFKTTVS
jgi:hypothetical protein